MDLAGATSALHTDRYELTMADAALASGLGGHRAVFEVFTRRLPPARRFGVLAGVGPLLEELGRFVLDDATTAWLVEVGALSPAGAEALGGRRFTGTVDGYDEGELFFPGSPVLTVTAPFALGTLVETLVLGSLNHASAVASAAARMRWAAGDRTLIEMGSRRLHPEAAVAAARAARLAGFDASSNLEAGRRYGVPTAGTAAHAFTLAHAGLLGHPTGSGHDDEIELAAFDAQIAAQGIGTTLLVDTFDIAQGTRNAVAAARRHGHPGPGGVRIDSGDPAVESRRVRALLDGAGATGTRIVVSGDVDEWAIAALETGDANPPGVRGRAPIDAYGIGSRVVAGSGHPSAGFVYKCVAVEVAPGSGRFVDVAKRSRDKASAAGRKLAHRRLGADGRAVAEEVEVRPGVPRVGPDGRLATDGPGRRALQRRLVDGGEVLVPVDLGTARRRCAASLAELPPISRLDPRAEPVLDATRR